MYIWLIYVIRILQTKSPFQASLKMIILNTCIFEFLILKSFSGSQAQVNTAEDILYKRSTETYRSEYEAGTSTILRKFYQNKNFWNWCFYLWQLTNQNAYSKTKIKIHLIILEFMEGFKSDHRLPFISKESQDRGTCMLIRINTYSCIEFLLWVSVMSNMCIFRNIKQYIYENKFLFSISHYNCIFIIKISR